MTILITGGNGQLGKALTKEMKKTNTIISLRREELDVTKLDQVEAKIYQVNPKIIIHAAAYTKVDQCEENKMTALEVNGLGVWNVVQIAKKIGARLFYISSDYVFDGIKNTPYLEEDKANPQTVYGLSKWLGETVVSQYNNATIIRTSWLYGHYGNNFAKTMLEFGVNGKEVRVVNDQVGSPTYVNDLVDIILLLLEKENGIYHVTNSGCCSWFTFAKTIFKEAGFDPNLILPITSTEYAAKAKRPPNSVLAHSALNKVGIKPLRGWEEALKDFFKRRSVND